MYKHFIKILVLVCLGSANICSAEDCLTSVDAVNFEGQTVCSTTIEEIPAESTEIKDEDQKPIKPLILPNPKHKCSTDPTTFGFAGNCETMSEWATTDVGANFINSDTSGFR